MEKAKTPSFIISLALDKDTLTKPKIYSINTSSKSIKNTSKIPVTVTFIAKFQSITN